MRICSFLPAATQALYRLGLENQVVGITFECPGDKPRVVRSRLEDQSLSASDIDETVASAKKSGQSLYYIDESLLATLAPDIIFTQDVCTVCQIDTHLVRQVAKNLPRPPKIVPLLPKRLTDVWANIRTIAQTSGVPNQGEELLASIYDRIDRVQQSWMGRSDQLRIVSFLEWPEPLFNCGHWIPDMIELAGGYDPLANPGGYSHRITFSDVQAQDPEIIVVAGCGLTVEQARKEMWSLSQKKGWTDLRAVRNEAVHVLPGDWFTCPGPGLVDGIERLASIFHSAPDYE